MRKIQKELAYEAYGRAKEAIDALQNRLYDCTRSKKKDLKIQRWGDEALDCIDAMTREVGLKVGE